MSRCLGNVYMRIPRREKALSSFFGTRSSFSTEAKVETKPFKLFKLDSGPSTSVSVTREEALQLYSQMNTVRRIETAAASLYKEKAIRGFCHLYAGQEAVAVGMKAVLRPGDSVITAYRAHGWAYVMGVSELGVLAELTGKQSGCSRGKGGSMHMYGPNFYGGNGIVGAQVPLGVGIAFAHKYTGSENVCVTLYGDGAANQGQVFEVFNLSKLLNAPCIFVCENNGYGMGTSSARATANQHYYTRGDYIPGIWMDGMDVLAVREATRYALEHIKSGKGPILLEAATYRYYGHSMSDPGTSYRTREEIQEVRHSRDPITSFREKMLSAELTNADELKKIDAEIRVRVDEAAKIAKADKEVSVDEMAADIYSNPVVPLVRGVLPWHVLKHKNVGKPKNL